MLDIRYMGVFGWEVFDTENKAPVAFYDSFEAAYSQLEKLTSARNNVTIASSNGEDNNSEEGAAFCENSTKT